MMVVFSQVIFSLGLMECYVRDLSQKRSLDYTWLGLRHSNVRGSYEVYNQESVDISLPTCIYFKRNIPIIINLMIITFFLYKCHFHW